MMILRLNPSILLFSPTSHLSHLRLTSTFTSPSAFPSTSTFTSTLSLTSTRLLSTPSPITSNYTQPPTKTTKLTNTVNPPVYYTHVINPYTAVHSFPCLGDNYGYILALKAYPNPVIGDIVIENEKETEKDSNTSTTYVAIDVPCAESYINVISSLANNNKKGAWFKHILNTHHHDDHTQGNAQVQSYRHPPSPSAKEWEGDHCKTEIYAPFEPVSPITARTKEILGYGYKLPQSFQTNVNNDSDDDDDDVGVEYIDLPLTLTEEEEESKQHQSYRRIYILKTPGHTLGMVGFYIAPPPPPASNAGSNKEKLKQHLSVQRLKDLLSKEKSSINDVDYVDFINKVFEKDDGNVIGNDVHTPNWDALITKLASTLKSKYENDMTVGIYFSSDLVFSLGCGRMFEGDVLSYTNSLEVVKKEVPRNTLVFPGHEYTESNLAFAMTVAPDNVALQSRAREIKTLRVKGLPTTPVLFGGELESNPFLRLDDDNVKSFVKSKGGVDGAGGDSEVFRVLREAKDGFRG